MVSTPHQHKGKTQFSISHLKRDYFNIWEVLGYSLDRDAYGEPEDEPPERVDDDNPLSSVSCIEWWDRVEDFADTERRLEYIAMSLTVTPRGPYELQEPWTRHNEVDYVPFVGWYHHFATDKSKSFVRCFAGFGHEWAICNSSVTSPTEPVDSESNSQPGQLYHDLFGQVDGLLEWFHDNAKLGGLLAYDDCFTWNELHPERANKHTYGRIQTDQWGKVPKLQFEHDPSLATETPSDTLFDSEYTRWQRDQQRPSTTTKRRRRRR